MPCGSAASRISSSGSQTPSFGTALVAALRDLGFPVCHIDDIIASKEAANRAKDRESLARLRTFRDYWKGRHSHPG
jgi:hypothetical protein